MVDILDELRHFARGGAGDVSATCSDAADMIERQRAALKRIADMDGYNDLPDARLVAERALEQKVTENG